MRIQIVNVSKSYGTRKSGEQRALHEVTLEVMPGEILTVVGPSGAGKSSLLRMVAGLDSPSSGQVLLDGKPVMSIPPANRGIFLLFPEALLYPNLSARGNLELALRNKGLGNAAITERIHAFATRFRIVDRLDALPEQLSNGERQRVALARAVLFEPDILLLDEPLAGLDPELRFQLKREIILLRERIGATVLCVTHDPIEGFTMGDRVAVMLGGKLQQVDAPDRVCREPANTFVAGFVGYPPINLIAGSLVDDDTGLRFTTGDPAGKREGFWVVPPSASLSRGYGSLIVGIRPDDIQVKAVGDEGEDGFEATLERTESYDGAFVLWIRCHGQPLVARSREPGQHRRLGPIMISIRKEGLLWFDGESLERVN